MIRKPLNCETKSGNCEPPRRLAKRGVQPFMLAAPVLVLAMATALPAQAMKKVLTLAAGLNKPILDDGQDYAGGMNIEVTGQLPIPFPLFDLELEAKLGANTFTEAGGGGNDAMLTRASLGIRGGINFAVYPYGYAHIGYGWLSGPYKHSTETIGAPTAEIGLGIDVTAMPYIRIGLFGAYNHMMFPDDGKYTSSTDRDMQWFSAGVKVGYVGTGED